MTGKFIVIEGTDGSGKGEQTVRLTKRLINEGYPVAPFDFPRYGEPSAWFVQEFLNGNFGSIDEVGPKTASLFYALDRYAAAPKVRAALAEGSVVISNRYVASSLAHQGSKFSDPAERRAYIEWNSDLEYGINGIPRPGLNIILHVPASVAQELVDKKLERQYLSGSGKKRDIHEADLSHLEKSERTYRELAEMFPDSFTMIECVEGGSLLSIDEIHERVWAVAKEYLERE